MARAKHILLTFAATLGFVHAVDNCFFRGTSYTINQQFRTQDCQVCLCTPNGQVACTSLQCPPLFCVDNLQKKGECCGYCPNGPNCKEGNHVIKANETYTLPDGRKCSCPFTSGSFFHGDMTKAVCN